jgi:nucleotide-binding universal stress UspA family protein
VGDPGPVIVRVADELSVDAIVIGSRGRGAIKRALLGSVSTHVANNTECPVIVISDND